MTHGRHEHFEELISASLGGELTDRERLELDAHLDTCAACRATLAAFADQRRIVAGLRHVGAPRDLGARVRAGIEGGAFAAVPWWRRPAVLFAGLGGGLAAVAGALLALVLLNPAPEQQVGDATARPTPSVSMSASQAPPIASATPSATPALTIAPTAEPTPAPPVELSPEPDAYLAYTGPFDNLVLTLRDGRSGATLQEIPVQGPPIAAELSPNGQFLAFITQRGQSGLNDVWVTHVPPGTLSSGARPPVETDLAEWETAQLGESMAGSELLEHMAWSPNSRWLAFTRADADGGGTDAWLFAASTGDVLRVTDEGTGYAASWVPDEAGSSQLWISHAGDAPTSDLIVVDDSGDPAECCGAPIATVPVFQPLVSPTGDHVIYWRGVMAQQGAEWAFAEGGAPYIAEARAGQGADFADERPLFSDVTIDRDAFVSAGIEWGADGDAYAVWRAEWAGISQGSQGEYPSIRRVYFGHATDERELTEDHAIDITDIPERASVVDVKVPTTRHLLVTASEPVGGDLEAPVARLLVITRNTGQVADEVAQIRADVDGGWFGPAAYDADPGSGGD